jgi:hypothetical protein
MIIGWVGGQISSTRTCTMILYPRDAGIAVGLVFLYLSVEFELPR